MRPATHSLIADGELADFDAFVDRIRADVGNAGFRLMSFSPDEWERLVTNPTREPPQRDDVAIVIHTEHCLGCGRIHVFGADQERSASAPLLYRDAVKLEHMLVFETRNKYVI